MKPFNLEEYLKNPSRKVVTRDGRNVRIICTNKRGTNFPIVALVECEDKEETCYYTLKGYWNLHEGESGLDLFFAPEKHEGWINIYKSKNWLEDYNIGALYNTKEDAKACISPDCIATIKIEWEE